jgi:D-tyrosyl-tRNA(Tyr) deacylase
VRIVLQRVTSADVRSGGEVVGAIGHGYLLLVGVEEGDTHDDAERVAAKVAAVRLFPEGERPFHLTLAQVGGSALVVSQFTLMGDVRRGNRPSWAMAAPPEVAEPLVAAVAAALGDAGIPVHTGRFGHHMDVSLVNDGPVTLVLESVLLPGGRGRGRPPGV